MKEDVYKFSGVIAPCGMNCGVCIAYMREKKPCSGCLANSENKPNQCRQCSVVHCEHLAKTTSKFCYECEKFPCARINTLDKRYRAKYRMSMIENLEKIRDHGIEKFLEDEEHRWDCPVCKNTISPHRTECSECKYSLKS